MAVADSLVAAKASIAALIATETAYQVTNGPRPSYSLDGESYDWPGWLSAMVEKIEKLNALIQVEDGAFEVRSYTQ